MRLSTAMRAAALTALTAGAAVVPAAAPAAATGSQPTDRIRSVATGRCLTQGTQIFNATYQAWCGYTWAQRWHRDHVWGDIYRIEGPQGARCLAVLNTFPGSPVRTQWCGSGNSQLWRITWTGDGYRLRNQASGLCLTAAGSYQVTQNYCGGGWFGGNQRWRFF